MRGGRGEAQPHPARPSRRYELQPHPVQVAQAAPDALYAGQAVARHEQALQAKAQADPRVGDRPGVVERVRAESGRADLEAGDDHVELVAVDLGVLAGELVAGHAGGLEHDDGQLAQALVAALEGRAELDQVEHGELVQMPAALRVAPKARADLVDRERLLPDAGEAAQERVEVGGEHRSQAAVAVEAKDLLAHLAARLDAHLAQGVAADDGRRHDLDQAGPGERGAQRLLQTAQRRQARARAQRFQRCPAGAGELRLETAEGRVARRRVGEGPVDERRRRRPARAGAGAGWR